MDKQLLLLGLLRQRSQHGYEMADYIERALASCVDLKKPTAYFLLDKMTAAGWLTHSSQRDGNRPARRVYQLTAEGEAQFQTLLRDNLAHFSDSTFPGDIGLIFVDALPRSESLALLARRRAALVTRQAEVRAAPPHPGPLQWSIDHLRRHLQAELDWLDDVIADLSSTATAARN
jgi:DNA-binding PadR family transcriptional regulator